MVDPKTLLIDFARGHIKRISQKDADNIRIKIESLEADNKTLHDGWSRAIARIGALESLIKRGEQHHDGP